LKYALYDFTSTRDLYREATTAAGIGMHRSLILTYIELQALLITPIAPHWADYVWQEILHKVSFLPTKSHLTPPTSPPPPLSSPHPTPSPANPPPQPTTIQTALYPARPPPSPPLTASLTYIRTTTSSITSTEAATSKRQAKGKTTSFSPHLPKKLTIYYATSFPPWQEKYIALVRAHFSTLTLTLDDKAVNTAIPNNEKKKAVPFVQGLKRRLMAGERGEVVFERRLAFEEGEVLGMMVMGLRKTTGCRIIEVVEVEEGGGRGVVRVGEGLGEVRENLAQVAGMAVPGQPSFLFENV